MAIRRKTPQLHLLAINDLLRIRVAPLQWHVGVCIGVYEHVESAVAVQHRQEGNRRRDLAEDSLNLLLNFLLRLFGWWLRSVILGRRVFFVGWF